MTFVGWIELEDKMFMVSKNDQNIAIEKYKGGSKVIGSLKSMTKVDFKEFMNTLNIDTATLPKGILQLLN